MEETISLKEIFEVLKKRIGMIIALVLLAALAATVVSYFILTPNYESTSQFIVNQGESNRTEAYNVNDVRTNVEMINTYNVIIKSPAILDDVVDTLNLPYTSKGLSEKLQISSEQDSQVVTVTATDPSPTLATDIANATVEIFEKEIPSIMNVDNVSVLSKAETDSQPSQVSPRPLLNIAIAIVLGGMVGVGLAFLLEYMDNTIKTVDDIENKLKIPVLGSITHMTDNDMRPYNLKMNQIGNGGGNHVRKKKTI